MAGSSPLAHATLVPLRRCGVCSATPQHRHGHRRATPPDSPTAGHQLRATGLVRRCRRSAEPANWVAIIAARVLDKSSTDPAQPALRRRFRCHHIDQVQQSRVVVAVQGHDQVALEARSRAVGICKRGLVGFDVRLTGLRRSVARPSESAPPRWLSGGRTASRLLGAPGAGL